MPPIRILHVEDVPADAEIALRVLLRAGLEIDVRRVDTEDRFVEECAAFDPHIILSDFSMPEFDGLSALAAAQRVTPATPFIFVSGQIGEETAIDALKRGATDYVLKRNLARLPAAVQQALERCSERAARQEAEVRLRESEHLFRAFMEHLPGMAFIKEPDGKLSFINRRAAELLGCPAEDVIGKTIDQLVDPQTAVVLGRIDETVLREDAAQHLVHTLGSKHLMTAKFPLRPDAGGRTLIGGISIDITDRLNAEEALRSSEERFKMVAQASSDALWDWNIETDEVWYNEGFLQQFGLDLGGADAAYRNRQAAIHGDERARVADSINAALRERSRVWAAEYRITTGSGAEAYVLDRAHIVYDDEQRPTRMIGAVMDLTRRRQTEEALLLRERAVESCLNPIVIVSATDPQMPVVYVNTAFEQVSGYAREEAIGQNCRFLQGTDREQPELVKIRRAIAEQRDGHALLRNYRKDGSLFWNDLYVSPVRDPRSGDVTHYVGVQYDITELKRYQEDLEHQANYDALTGLPNRNLFKDRLEQAIAGAHRYTRSFTVAFIDLDNFKLINDSLGHPAGDDVLKIIAGRLSGTVREADTIARLGGDEFVLLLADEPRDDAAVAVVQRALAAVAEPVFVEGRQYKVTCSIGVARYPNDGQDSDVLLRNADTAMYRAKDSGRNAIRTYARDMNAHIGERLSLEADLWHALERDEFVLHYQPKVNLANRKVIGLEALIRWRRPNKGLVPPGAFIGIAEETSLIIPIGNWVLAAACAQSRALQDAGFAPTPIAVNVSARQLRDKALVDNVRKALATARLDPRWLELEVTESAVMHSPDEAVRVLTELSDMGVQISLDDFGTGYSSFSYLRRFPVDRLKIDRSFVAGVCTDADHATIARSIIALASEMGLRVTAEGVETAEQAAFLLAHKCAEAQGYYFCKPVPAAEVTALLPRGRLVTA